MLHDRMIRASFATSPSLNQCTLEAFMFWFLLPTATDHQGRFDASPRVVRVNIFPMRDDVTDEMVEGWLDEFERVGQIRRWRFEEHVYGEILRFAKHQHIRNNKRPSKIPHPDDEPEQPTITADSRLPADVLALLQQLYVGTLNSTHVQKVVQWMFGRDKFTSSEVLYALEAAKGTRNPLSYAEGVMRNQRLSKKLEEQKPAKKEKIPEYLPSRAESMGLA